MNLAPVLQFPIPENDDDGREEDLLAMSLTKEQLQAMATQVHELYEKRKEDNEHRRKVDIAILTLIGQQKALQSKNERTDGRLWALEHGKRMPSDPPDPTSVELEALEKTDAGLQVKMTIPRAGQLLESEKREAELSQLLARYRWWTGTIHEAGWGLLKLAGKVVGTGALGWIGHTIYVYIKSH